MAGFTSPIIRPVTIPGVKSGAKLPAVKPPRIPFSGGVGLPFGDATGPGTTQIAKPPGAPPAPPHAPAGQPPPAQPPSPLDSQYYANVNQYLFDTGNKINGLAQQRAYAQTDLQKALAGLAQQTPLQERTAQERANNAGLLSSTALGNTLGQIGQSAADRQAGLQSNFGRQQAAASSQIEALQGGIPLYENSQYADAVARAAAAAAADPSLGAPAPPAAKAAPKFRAPGTPPKTPVQRGVSQRLSGVAHGFSAAELRAALKGRR